MYCAEVCDPLATFPGFFPGQVCTLFWVSMGQYLVVLDQYRAVLGGTGSVWGSTGWYLVILGQFNLVLFGVKWYWVIKGLLCLYILKKLMVTSTNRPTNRQGEYRAICLFRKLENRKKAEICNWFIGGALFVLRN